MTATEELKLRLTETLSDVDAGKVSADGLKDHRWLICHAMRAAITELREAETSPQPPVPLAHEPT